MVPATSLFKSLTVQIRVIHALLMREVITRFGRNNLGVLWLFFEPMLFTSGVTALWSAAGMRNHSSGLPIIAFAITGYSSVLLWRNSATHCSMAVNTNRALLFHRNVTVLDLLLTRVIIEFCGASASFIILSSLFIALGWMQPPADLARVLEGWFMMAWFGGSLAMLVGAVAPFSEVVERIWHPIAYLLFPLSGAAFMVDWLPTDYQRGILIVPMVHAVEIVREGYFGNVVRAHYSLPYLSTVSLLLMLAALKLSRSAALHVEMQ